MEHRGNRWYKTDFHLHTPASKCFKDQNVTPEQWVNRCLEQNLNVVAVTDHNTGAFIDSIKEASANTSLTVFPGVEVTCGESKVHMLVIFDKDKGTQFVEDFLLSIDIEREAFATSEAYTPLSSIDLVKKVDEKGGIAIPAHIDEFNGLCEIAHVNRGELLNSPLVNGVHIVHKVFLNTNVSNTEIERTLEEYYNRPIGEETYKKWKVTAQLAKSHNKSILSFSDNPDSYGDSKHGLWGIGNRFTWIKMDEDISFESLRQALLLPEHRIRNDFLTESAPYNYPDSWIKSLKVNNTELNENEVEFCFNPQMTTIIGGRGTGKSSLIRFIRGVFNKISDLKGLSNLSDEQQNFFKVKQNDDGVLKKESILEMIIVRFGKEFKVNLSDFTKNGPELVQVYEYDNYQQEFLPLENRDILSIFNIDIFSQKQIFEIAKKPNALRERIDNPIKEISIIKEELNNIKSKYLEQSLKVRRNKLNIERKTKIIAEINDKKEQISSFKESGFESLIGEYKNYNSQFSELKILVNQLSQKESFIKAAAEQLEIKEVPNTDKFPSELREEVDLIIDETIVEYTKIQSLLEDAQTRTTKLIHEYKGKLNQTEWSQNYNKIKSDFDTTKNSLSEKGITDLSKLEVVTEELTSLEESLKSIIEIEGTLEIDIEKQREIRDEFVEKRKEITSKRREFINGVISDQDNIRIEIKPFRDSQNFKEVFRRIIQKETGFDDDVNKIVQSCFTGGDVILNIAGLVKEFKDIRKGTTSNLELGGRMLNVIKSLNEEQIDELTLLVPEDEIGVKYKPNGSSSFKVLTNASAGQKTSAILTFLLSFGESPLLLDQPEDDLDNHLIYDLIVERLKRTKERRQIVVVSHNANIPVNGDSEWVICMDSEASGISSLCSGAVEEGSIRREICDVMEGGETAFKLRARRYNLS
ncbi:PHP domain-containing protein [Rossellomorea vietnamensis]|uniref:PHP domain-containing protein n=1 Tax=Rossellomorea vietnamensis TaxID=218284 RepID=A0A5D4M712_9BACI|nr:PHP domain-containing protein [Rossellomorea vietnamensis]TYR97386.1 PHP domain-containing protein [Rossellomorea vietnamensis]